MQKYQDPDKVVQGGGYMQQNGWHAALCECFFCSSIIQHCSFGGAQLKCVCALRMFICMLCCAACCCLLQVAADPNTLYPILIDSPAVTTLANLLGHDNTDIAVEVMDLLQELTDAGGVWGTARDHSPANHVNILPLGIATVGMTQYCLDSLEGRRGGAPQ
jgi:hypothetical protein